MNTTPDNFPPAPLLLFPPHLLTKLPNFTPLNHPANRPTRCPTRCPASPAVTRCSAASSPSLHPRRVSFLSPPPTPSITPPPASVLTARFTSANVNCCTSCATPYPPLHSLPHYAKLPAKVLLQTNQNLNKQPRHLHPAVHFSTVCSRRLAFTSQPSFSIFHILREPALPFTRSAYLSGRSVFDGKVSLGLGLHVDLNMSLWRMISNPPTYAGAAQPIPPCRHPGKLLANAAWSSTIIHATPSSNRVPVNARPPLKQAANPRRVGDM